MGHWWEVAATHFGVNKVYGTGSVHKLCQYQNKKAVSEAFSDTVLVSEQPYILDDG